MKRLSPQMLLSSNSPAIGPNPSFRGAERAFCAPDAFAGRVLGVPDGSTGRRSQIPALPEGISLLLGTRLCRPARILVRFLAFTLLFAAATTAQQAAPAGTEKLYSRAGHRWFEDAGGPTALSSDGKWALLAAGGDLELVSLATRRAESARLRGGLDSVKQAVFCGGAELLRQGKRGAEEAWFVPSEEKGLEPVTLRPDAVPLCSSDAKRSAYFRAGAADGGLSVGGWKERKKIAVEGVITGAAFSPDAQSVYVLSRAPNGGSSLLRVNAQTGRVDTLARDLDAAPGRSPLSVSPDGARLYLSLAGQKAPDVAERQKPEAQRFLNLYEFDLSSRRLKLLVPSGVDKTAPVEANGYLYWAQSVLRDSVVVLPAAGGAAREVIAGAQIPVWSRDARRIGFAFGDWRLADWALSLDSGAVGVDAEARRTSDRTVVVAGNHEDFPAEWSPDGKWIAFHSHRAPQPIAAYDAPGATDDIYLRRADDPRAPEIRLTDFGWEVGSPSWSPDGRKLLFSSWEKGGKPGVYSLWITTIDPETGRGLSSEKLPLPPEVRSAEWAVWSPRGSEIAIEDQSAPGERTLWILNEQKLDRLASYKSDTYGGLDWTPDGKTIVYSALQEGRMQIFAVSRAGGTPRKLSNDAAGLMHPRVSPDGRWIACTRQDSHHEIWRKKL